MCREPFAASLGKPRFAPCSETTANGRMSMLPKGSRSSMCGDEHIGTLDTGFVACGMIKSSEAGSSQPPAVESHLYRRIPSPTHYRRRLLGYHWLSFNMSPNESRVRLATRTDHLADLRARQQPSQAAARPDAGRGKR
jgi:hypothetical protein